MQQAMRGGFGRGRVRLAILLLAASVAVIAHEAAQPARPPASAPARPSAPAADTTQPAERSAVGTLDQVDVARMQIVVKTTPTERMTFQVAAGATIRQGSRTLKPAELASHKGERVKIRYRDSGGQHRTSWITLAAPPPRVPKKPSDS